MIAEQSAVAWTGHRPDLFADPPEAARTVREVARSIGAGTRIGAFVTGGQRGVDLWAAATGLELGIAVRVILPTAPERFCAGWSVVERAELERIIGQAAQVQIVDASGRLGSLAFDLRNDALVRGAGRLVAIWTELRQGGTFYTVCAARRRGMPITQVVLARALARARSGRGL